jgi:hypothetical protein
MKKLLPFPKLQKKAQDTFNKWIRTRDKDLGCISCGSGIDHAGHYFSAGHFTSLRFNEINVNGQCLRCNNYLHGNLIHYRQGLIQRFGEDKVLLLESASRNAVKKWTRLELEIICSEYKIKK